MPIIILNDDLSIINNKFTHNNINEVYGISDKNLISSEKDLIVSNISNHQFLNTIIYAYNNHIGLIIKPDDILQCVSHAVYNCINDHSEEYKDIFSVCKIYNNELIIETKNDLIENIINDISVFINKNIYSKLNLESEFTTSTNTTKLVSQISKISSISKYSSYTNYEFFCGIRKINLTGTLEDWLLLKNKIVHTQKIINSKNHMINWFKHILTIVDLLIDTYLTDKCITDELKIFWSRIITYIPYGSGNQKYISGWSKILFPGIMYDSYPEVLKILNPKSYPIKSNNLYSNNDQLKKWVQLYEDAPFGISNLKVKINRNEIYLTTGFIGYKVIDDFVLSEIGYIINY